MSTYCVSNGVISNRIVLSYGECMYALSGNTTVNIFGALRISCRGITPCVKLSVWTAGWCVRGRRSFVPCGMLLINQK